jgi:hypothetical protein
MSNEPTISNGSRNEFVTYLQQMLLYLGYQPGPVDGIFGDQTEDAVRALQRDNNIDIDGIVGEQTWPVIADLAARVEASASSTTATHETSSVGSTPRQQPTEAVGPTAGEALDRFLRDYRYYRGTGVIPTIPGGEEDFFRLVATAESSPEFNEFYELWKEDQRLDEVIMDGHGRVGRRRDLMQRDEIERRQRQFEALRTAGPVGLIATAIELWRSGDINAAAEAAARVMPIDRILRAYQRGVDSRTQIRGQVEAAQPPRVQTSASSSPEGEPADR